MSRSLSRSFIATLGIATVGAALTILFVNCGGRNLAMGPAAPSSPVFELSANQLQNPVVLAKDGEDVVDTPDPNVFKLNGRYYLTYTPSFGNISIFVSDDLKNWAFDHYAFAADDAQLIGNALKIGAHYYCNIWAPELHADDFGGIQLSFTAVRLSQLPDGECPDFNENSGVYFASAESIHGYFAVQATHPNEPFALGNHADCSEDPEGSPTSPDEAYNSCQGRPCDAVPRLDQTIFKDRGKTWLGYSWYTNSVPSESERGDDGEHLSVTELDPSDDYALPCRSRHERIALVDPHDQSLVRSLAGSCPFCGNNLSFSTDRFGRPYAPYGFVRGVAEGASFFRRGDWVYLLASGGLWDSSSYHVFWIAAHTIEELSQANVHRLVGRYLVPEGRFSYGHGSVVEGPGGDLFYVYHRLDHDACARSGDCGRRLMISPITFEDHGDGNGKVAIVAREPASSDNLVNLHEPAFSPGNSLTLSDPHF